MLRSKISHLLLSPDSEGGGGVVGSSAAPPATTGADGGLTHDKVMSVSAEAFKAGKIPGAPARQISGDDGDSVDEVLDSSDFVEGVKPDTGGAKEVTAKELAAKKQRELDGDDDNVPLDEAIKQGMEAAGKKAEVVAKKEEIVKPVAPAKGDGRQVGQIVAMQGSEARDLTGIPEADQKAFRGMPNPVFNYVAPRFKALIKREAEATQKFEQIVKDQGVPLSYFEHPQGFRITPQAAQIQQEYNDYNFELGHVQEQIAALKSGAKTVKEIVNYDAQGNAIYAERVVDDNNRATFLDSFVKQEAKAGILMGQLDQKFSSLAQNHIARNKQVTTSIKQAEAKYFPFYEEGQLTFGPAEKEKFNNFMATLPPETRGSPLASPLAKAYMVIQEMNILLKKQAKQLAGSKQVIAGADERQLAGPTGDEVTTHGGGNEEGEMLTNKGWDDDRRAM